MLATRLSPTIGALPGRIIQLGQALPGIPADEVPISSPGFPVADSGVVPVARVKLTTKCLSEK